MWPESIIVKSNGSLKCKSKPIPHLKQLTLAKDKYAEPLECQESQVQGTNYRHDFPPPVQM